MLDIPRPCSRIFVQILPNEAGALKHVALDPEKKVSEFIHLEVKSVETQSDNKIKQDTSN